MIIPGGAGGILFWEWKAAKVSNDGWRRDHHWDLWGEISSPKSSSSLLSSWSSARRSLGGQVDRPDCSERGGHWGNFWQQTLPWWWWAWGWWHPRWQWSNDDYGDDDGNGNDENDDNEFGKVPFVDHVFESRCESTTKANVSWGRMENRSADFWYSQLSHKYLDHHNSSINISLFFCSMKRPVS